MKCQNFCKKLVLIMNYFNSSPYVSEGSRLSGGLFYQYYLNKYWFNGTRTSVAQLGMKTSLFLIIKVSGFERAKNN